ncbi:YidC/Oxa1 family membrane protein insertase [Wukongibacter sp. M2B1]|uniref:YidC/Oxa1 family membrane protein insertase n=1 Tax=Wukongibacter sp. M2B1 TaxID=3088895 RepID=UPI003D7AA958
MITNIFQLIIDNINSVTNDYGLTIILVTLLINLLMLPLTIKQRKSMKSMQNLTNKVNDIKEKYRNDENRMNEEVQKLYQSNSKSFLGCMTIFIQMPIFIVLYRLFTNNIVDTTTRILPWVTSLTLPDPYYILPVVYVLIQLIPSILVHFQLIKNTNISKLSKQTVILPIVMALLLVAKMPSALGIYFITSAFIQSIQQISI